MAESVELATVLFVDLVGSTRLASSVGPVRADELREEYFALLRDAVQASGGREVKNLGDGLMLAFSSASAGVGCSVLMQQLFERRYRGAEQQLHVRIGLGTGESTVKDGDYFGMPTVEAARLCDKAPADEILISPATRMMAGRVDGARFESAGELELKGIAEPVEAFSVLWEPLDPERSGATVGRWPLPEVLRSVPRAAYVGRVTERGLLEHARNRARSGSRGVVLLAGEPGIGKTRLAAYTALGASADGFAVCWGACSEDLAAPYEPWIEVCSQLVAHTPDDVLAEFVERSGGEIGRLAGNLSHRLPEAPPPQSSDPETERFLLFKAVAELLRAVAAAVPLCVVLDDFHWADGQSVALLKHVARSVEQGALQIMVTYRDSDLTKDHPLTRVLADLRRFEGVERVALTGLGPDEVAELLSAAAGHELDQAGLQLAGELATETGGNPFFVGEILRNLTESGAITFDEAAGRWNVDLAGVSSLPESVRDVIERRIDRLGEGGREALRIAAVIGRSFDVRLLAELVEIPEGRLLDELEAAVGAALLRESTDQVGRFTFEHALINHTLYQGIGATRRARIHHRVALALESLYGGDADEQLAELAMHWRLATVSVDEGKAAAYSLRAGRRALDSLAPIEAAKLFGDALELLGQADTSGRCEALIGLGEAQRHSGDPAYRGTLLEASRVASVVRDGELAARAALANNRGIASVLGEVDRERIAAIERALELDDPPHPARRARLLALQAQELAYDHDFARRRALADEALALARGADDAKTLADVLHLVLFALWSVETLELRSVLVEELCACAFSLSDPALRFWVHDDEVHVFTERGELARAQAALDKIGLIADELGQPTMKWIATFSAAALYLVRGDLVAGERLAERAFEIGKEAGESDAILVYSAQLAYIRIHQGRAQEIVPMLEQSVRAYPGLPTWNSALAYVLALVGRRAEATAILQQAAADRFEHLPRSTNRGDGLAFYAETAVQIKDEAAAAILYELIEPLGDQLIWDGGFSLGHVRMYLGLLADILGRHEQADQHLQFACEYHEANGMLVAAARAHLGWAQSLADRGETEQAQAHADRALELSEEHGYGLFEESAAAPALGDGRMRPVRALAARTGRRALAAMVRGQDDEQLERRFSEPRRQRSLLRAAARGFQPAHADGFSGVIAYELTPYAIEPPPDAPWRWAIEVDSDKGSARVLEPAPADAAVTIRAGLADWVRVSAGVENPLILMTGGRFNIDGDVLLAARLEAMFGAS